MELCSFNKVVGIVAINDVGQYLMQRHRAGWRRAKRLPAGWFASGLRGFYSAAGSAAAAAFVRREAED